MKIGQPYCRQRAALWDWVGIRMGLKTVCRCPKEKCYPFGGEPRPFPVEVVPDATIPNAWRVEKLDSDGDGGVDVTIFAGPAAHERATEYARQCRKRVLGWWDGAFPWLGEDTALVTMTLGLIGLCAGLALAARMGWIG